MKILVVGSRVPWPLKDGGAIAIYRILKGLSDAGAEVVFFSYNTRKHFVNEKDIARYFSFCKVYTHYIDSTPSLFGAIQHIFSGQNYNISRFYNSEAIHVLSRIVEQESPDVIHFDSLYSTPLLSAVRDKNIPLVLRQHNVEFKIWEKLAATASNPLKKWYFRHLSSQLKTYELATLREFTAVVPITAEDKEVFAAAVPGLKYHTCSVGIPEADVQTEFSSDQPSFFHIGSMEWMPNVQGVNWLLTEVWPLLKEKLPRAVLHLAGKGMQPGDPRFSGSDVFVHGEVASAEDFMLDGGIMCIPLFSGGGVRVKMLEAMSLGIAVVSTETGASGAGAHHGTHFLLSSTAPEFADSMFQLATNSSLRENLTTAARKMVQSQYGLSTLSANLLNFYKSLRNLPHS